jgi:hypothetical protein
MRMASKDSYRISEFGESMMEIQSAIPHNNEEWDGISYISRSSSKKSIMKLQNNLDSLESPTRLKAMLSIDVNLG